MTISEIGQSMPMSAMYGMQPPRASDMASRIIDDLDTDGDGVLSADEISKGGNRAQKILNADADGDGFVTEDELISQISDEGMQPPSASDMASHIIDELDTNGDGVLSAEEISNGGERAQRILDADSDGDRLVTKDELISRISEDMKNMEGFPGLPDGETPDINQLKSILAQMSTEQSGQSGSDAISQVLNQMNLSNDEAETVLEMMRNSGVSLTA